MSETCAQGSAIESVKALGSKGVASRMTEGYAPSSLRIEGWKRYARAKVRLWPALSISRLQVCESSLLMISAPTSGQKIPRSEWRNRDLHDSEKLMK